MRHKIRLDTMQDIKNFVDAVTGLDAKVTLESSDGFKVNAKSFLGAMAAVEWDDLWVVSDKEIYQTIQDYVI